jgi:hypothetical protein
VFIRHCRVFLASLDGSTVDLSYHHHLIFEVEHHCNDDESIVALVFVVVAVVVVVVLRASDLVLFVCECVLMRDLARNYFTKDLTVLLIVSASDNTKVHHKYDLSQNGNVFNIVFGKILTAGSKQQYICIPILQ